MPCFNLLYKDRLGRPPPGTAETQSTSATHTGNQDGDVDDDGQEERKVIDIDFQELYYRYANEQNEEMRVCAASCLHEGFLLASPLENIKKLKLTLLDLLEEEHKDILLALIPNIRILIESFCNEHAMN